MWCSKNKILLTLCLLMTGIFCGAQYRPQYSQYMFNGMALNPAYVGCREVLSLATLYRSSQWGKSVTGAPVTYTFSGDFPMKNPQLALGMLIFDDAISIFRQTGAYFAYAFHVKTAEGTLSLGLQAGFDLHREDASRIILIDDDDPMFATRLFRSFMPNAGVGTFYYTKSFFVGLSLPQILTYSPKGKDLYESKPALSNTMLYGGYVIPAGNLLKIKPSTLIHYVGKGLLVDVNCIFSLLGDKFEVGVSWRNSTTLVAMTQFRFQSFCLGYAYDYALNKPNALNTSHELMLRYELKYIVNAANPLHYIK